MCLFQSAITLECEIKFCYILCGVILHSSLKENYLQLLLSIFCFLTNFHVLKLCSGMSYKQIRSERWVGKHRILNRASRTSDPIQSSRDTKRELVLPVSHICGVLMFNFLFHSHTTAVAI